MKASEVYVSAAGNFIKAADLAGRKWKLTIKAVRLHTFQDGNQQIVLAFQESKKELGLNRINGTTIAGLYGDETDGWIGKAIIAYPAVTLFQGSNVDCVRVENPVEAADPESGTPF